MKMERLEQCGRGSRTPGAIRGRVRWGEGVRSCPHLEVRLLASGNF